MNVNNVFLNVGQQLIQNKYERFNKMQNSKKCPTNMQIDKTNNGFYCPCYLISFAGNSKNINCDNKILNGIKDTGFVGATFLILLGTTTALAKASKPDEIFLSDGTYVGNAAEMSFKSKYLNVDGDDGVFQIKGTGIDINPNRFDVVDPQNGRYINFKKGIDIDLLNNKYIDPENGIFVDPVSKISTVIDNGVTKHIAIPNFSGAYPGADSLEQPYYVFTKNVLDDGIIPALVDKIKATIYLVNGNEKFLPGYVVNNNQCISAKEWYMNQKDCFGRKIITSTDNNYLTTVPIDEKGKEIFKDFISQGFSEERAAQMANDTILNDFLDANNIPINLPFNSLQNIADLAPIGESEIVENAVIPDMNVVEDIIKELEENGEVFIPPNSYEAIQFAVFQENLLQNGDILSPIIEYTELLNADTLKTALEKLVEGGFIDNADSYLEILGNIIDGIL